MDTLAKYPLTLEVDKTLEVRTTMAQLMELVEGRQMEGSVKSISNHPRGSSPYIKKKTIVSRDRTIFFDLLSRLHLRSDQEYTLIYLLVLALGALTNDWLLVLETWSHILALYDRVRLSFFVTVVRYRPGTR
jgi:hypothetical protein